MSKYLSWKVVCSDDRVEKVWFTGGCSAKPNSIDKTNDLLIEYIEAKSVDGQRFSKCLEDGQMTSLDIPEFDEWVESLNKKQ